MDWHSDGPSKSWLGRLEHPVECFLRDSPFPHLLLAGVLESDLESKCIDTLDAASWSTNSGGFFRFDSPSTIDPTSEVNELIGEDFWNTLRLTYENLFGCSLSMPVLDLHRYVKDCALGPHTDAVCREIRMVLNLNDYWEEANGGVWVLASDSALRSNRVFLPPFSNSGFAFPTGTNSFHALSTFRSGSNYCLVARFSKL
jgi:hypothetical protein